VDLNKLKTYSIKKRKSKVDRELFAKPLKQKATFNEFFHSLPNILKVKDLREVVDAIVSAKNKKKPVIFLMGAHVIKCGLSPLVIELIERNIITTVAMNGAGVIHDFEVAFCGETSEDVTCAIKDGSFGMSRETAEFVNFAVSEGVYEDLGFGEAMGAKIAKEGLKNKELSIAYTCFKKGIPLTVHVALGTDIVHQHPSANGAHIGEASLKDFRRLTVEVAKINQGGVVINMGSAVILPEVFLKALSVARNIKGQVTHFTTANFDMNTHYRPMQNIVCRPTDGTGKGYYIVGHHEIMLPLLAQAVIEKM
jgi:deoxyhypusine synthase